MLKRTWTEGRELDVFLAVPHDFVVVVARRVHAVGARLVLEIEVIIKYITKIKRPKYNLLFSTNENEPKMYGTE